MNLPHSHSHSIFPISHSTGTPRICRVVDRRILLLAASLLGLVGCGAANVQTGPDGTQAAGAKTGGTPGAVSGGGGNLLLNGTFDDGTSLPWNTSFTAPGDGKADVVNGEFCVEVKNKGTNAWDAQVRHREMVIQKNHVYTVRFKAHASTSAKVRPKVGMSGPPYSEHWSSTIDVTTTPQLYVGRFKMGSDDDRTAEFAFHMGGKLGADAAPFTLCIDDLELVDPEFNPPAKPVAAKLPAVRLNQLGFFPHFPKRATLKHASRAPVDWELVAAGGSVAAKGKSVVHGEDKDSGEHVHVVDFSSFDKPGKGYVLRAGGGESHPFDIGTDLYKKLKYDALAYFYHNRSGIPIAMPYAGAEQWTRPAGHTSDKSVPCAKDAGCNYSLDVSGGWYDAGDHGKYVVNGGISAWTLLNQYERAQTLKGSVADFGDGKLAIPESKNKTPDLLDEARVEVEFMLKMQIPAGKPKAGMVHHKIHDVEWTALGMAPHESKMKRALRPPSTAATLNLAAVAAQGARLYKAFDAGFSAKCLAAAESAWVAAKANPAVYAPGSDKTGGGPYDDKDVTDEFYWAAAELFITTGKPEYRDYVLRSPYFKRFPSTAGGAGGGAQSSMTWQSTQALGSISLAVAPSGLDKGAVAALRAQIVAAGDAFAATAEKQGYRVPVSGGQAGKYPWGSNSLVLNNMLVLALAHDFSGKPKYLNAVVDGMDYLLGRNPLAKSYVTGYGEHALENPHHRFWAFQANAKYPKAPPGAVSGGPNSGLEDPYAQAAGLKGCAPQKCFVDHIEAWSVNEITINWNAPLAWVAAYLDEKARSAP
jgi:endoglucanase